MRASPPPVLETSTAVSKTASSCNAPLPFPLTHRRCRSPSPHRRRHSISPCPSHLVVQRWRGYSDNDDSYPSPLPINLDDRARHGDSGDGRPSLFSSAFKQEESARGWGVVVEERGAGAVGEVASLVVPGWFGHDRSTVDDDGDELGTTGSGDL
uniref:Uncharacterized protein n=1 Tax=Oryza meridionalis TaxID=40149 RepID=A0A0E0EY44_9ORYZ